MSVASASYRLLTGDGESRRRRITILIVGAVALGIAIFGLITGLSGGGSRPSLPITTNGQLPPDLGPHAADTDTSIPITPFPVHWDEYNTAIVPSGGNMYGPVVVNGSVATGYARTPRSAVVAAIQNETRAWLSSGSDWPPVRDALVMPGPGRDMLDSYHIQQPGRTIIPEGGFARVQGFRVISYDSNMLTVSLASRANEADPYQITEATVVWNGGTWRLVLQPDGGTGGVPGDTRTDLTGYVPFALPW